ncbi:TAFII55 protein conserved region-domain-containing protein [Podospora didyma]|uniref:TAFII55 protein conserved region-domain-containing protein n=1 Tax=Podospora didyma TaxID=330526 RepID=A0AAE0U861_9PEZI|nr:TAFII55 protein conserved region-domain-containing protein [Podospora didyma]
MVGLTYIWPAPSKSSRTAWSQVNPRIRAANRAAECAGATYRALRTSLIFPPIIYFVSYSNRMEQKPPPPPPKRLTLKLSSQNKAGGGTPSATSSPSFSYPSAASPPPLTPGGGQHKIKINLSKRSQPPTPAEKPATPSIIGRSSAAQNMSSASTPEPTPEKIAYDYGSDDGRTGIPKITKTKPPNQLLKQAGRKRTKDESDADEEPRIPIPSANARKPLPSSGLSARTPLPSAGSQEPALKRTKITLKGVGGSSERVAPRGNKTLVKVKRSGAIPQRTLGEGYDSEASDREPDPVDERQFILRLMPGDDCDALRKAINERRVGIHKSAGGFDMQMKFLEESGRRMLVTIQGQPYAAILLDLPTITETMKTWDKKNMVKSADVCQMALVFAKVSSEEEARTVPLPKAVEHGHRWPHGITPPMHDARNRRFRKRLSKLQIQNKEAEVERLMAADEKAKSSRYEYLVEDSKMNGDGFAEGDEDEGADADGDGEADDYFGDAGVEEEYDENLYDEEALEAAFFQTDTDPLETPVEQPKDLATPAVEGVDAITPITANTGTPAAQTEESGAEADGANEEESEEDEEDEGDDGEMDDDDDDDDDRHDNVAGIRAQITDLRKRLAGFQSQLAGAVGKIMRNRLEANIKNIRSEITLKLSAIGETEDED